MALFMDAMQVGLLGCGNVGSAVARVLHEHAQDIARRAGVRIEVARVAVRDLSRHRDAPIEPTTRKARIAMPSPTHFDRMRHDQDNATASS